MSQAGSWLLSGFTLFFVLKVYDTTSSGDFEDLDKISDVGFFVAADEEVFLGGVFDDGGEGGFELGDGGCFSIDGDFVFGGDGENDGFGFFGVCACL